MDLVANFQLFVLACIIHGIGDGTFAPIALTLRQKFTPKNMLGRMNAVHRFVLWGGMPIGSILASIFTNIWGLQIAFYIGCFGAWLCLIALFRRGIKSDIMTAEKTAVK